VNNPRSQKQGYAVPGAKQQGIALILVAFMLGLAVTTLLIANHSVTSNVLERERMTRQALSQAKESLIAWAVSHEYNPGQFPWPDRNGDGNYDGSSDCATNSFAYSLFIGRLPSQPATSPCYDPKTGLNIYAGYSVYPGVGKAFTDGHGNELWYAVSRNIVRNNQTGNEPDINPSIIDNPPLEPWLRVFDLQGNLVSNRVAAVIIAPGPPLNGQSRSTAAAISNYLDQITVGATTYSNRDYGEANEDFFIGNGSNNTFNDTLIYITIDELIAALEKRVAAEAKAALLAYRLDNGGAFPFASPIGSTLNYSCKENLTQGFLPLDSPVAFSSTVSCMSGNNCNGIDFSDISSVSFTNTTINFNWTGNTGSCTRSGRSCTCSGAGSCTIFGVINYSCNSTGACTANLVNGSTAFIPAKTDVITTTGSAVSCGTRVTVPATGGATFTGATCSNPGLSPKFTVSRSGTSLTGSGFNDQLIQPGMYISGNGIQDGTVVSSVSSDTSLTMSKSTTAAGSSEIRISRLQPWFFENGWSNYVYYAVSKSPAGLTVGSKSEVEAVLITIGKEITDSPFAESKEAMQSRTSSCSATDYLDSDANANSDEIYDASNRRIRPDYNDQIFIVSP